MKLCNYLTPEYIAVGITAASKEEEKGKEDKEADHGWKVRRLGKSGNSRGKVAK